MISKEGGATTILPTTISTVMPITTTSSIATPTLSSITSSREVTSKPVTITTATSRAATTSLIPTEVVKIMQEPDTINLQIEGIGPINQESIEKEGIDVDMISEDFDIEEQEVIEEDEDLTELAQVISLERIENFDYDLISGDKVKRYRALRKRDTEWRAF